MHVSSEVDRGMCHAAYSSARLSPQETCDPKCLSDDSISGAIDFWDCSKANCIKSEQKRLAEAITGKTLLARSAAAACAESMRWKTFGQPCPRILSCFGFSCFGFSFLVVAASMPAPVVRCSSLAGSVSPSLGSCVSISSSASSSWGSSPASLALASAACFRSGLTAAHSSFFTASSISTSSVQHSASQSSLSSEAKSGQEAQIRPFQAQVSLQQSACRPARFACASWWLCNAPFQACCAGRAADAPGASSAPSNMHTSIQTTSKLAEVGLLVEPKELLSRQAFPPPTHLRPVQSCQGCEAQKPEKLSIIRCVPDSTRSCHSADAGSWPHGTCRDIFAMCHAWCFVMSIAEARRGLAITTAWVLSRSYLSSAVCTVVATDGNRPAPLKTHGWKYSTYAPSTACVLHKTYLRDFNLAGCQKCTRQIWEGPLDSKPRSSRASSTIYICYR